jgi:hypothetical protein
MPLIKNLILFVKERLFILPLAALDGVIGRLLFHWSIPVAMGVGLGIFFGYVVAERIFKRGGVDVIFTPIFLAFLLALVAAWLTGSPLTGKQAVLLLIQVMSALVVGLLIFLQLGKMHDKLLRKWKELAQWFTRHRQR